MSQCWPLQGMTPAQKAVLISLADNANDEGVCWPAVKTIAIRTCLSERAVQGAIKWLASAGILAAQGRNGRSTVYQITPAAYAPPQEMRPAGNAPTPAAGALTPADPAEAPADAAPRTINNHQGTAKEPSKERVKTALPDWLPLEAWDMWSRFRKKASGAKWTDDAKRISLATLKNLHADGHDPTAVIEQSIERGWTGLFPLKIRVAAGATRHGNFSQQNYHAGVGADGSF